MQKEKDKITELRFELPDGKRFVVPVYLSGKRSCRIYVEYGKIVGFIGSNIKQEKALSTVAEMVKKYKGLPTMTFESVLDWNNEPKTVYFLGKKRILTNDISKKNNSNFFYLKKNVKFQNAYDKKCLEYLKERIIKEYQRSDIQVDSFENRFRAKIGNYRSKIASVVVQLLLFRFDRRLFAYTQEVIDSVVDHELTHLKNANHSKQFYEDLYRLCPKTRYNNCRKAIEEGRFTYVPTENN